MLSVSVRVGIALASFVVAGTVISALNPEDSGGGVGFAATLFAVAVYLISGAF